MAAEGNGPALSCFAECSVSGLSEQISSVGPDWLVGACPIGEAPTQGGCGCLTSALWAGARCLCFALAGAAASGVAERVRMATVQHASEPWGVPATSQEIEFDCPAHCM